MQFYNIISHKLSHDSTLVAIISLDFDYFKSRNGTSIPGLSCSKLTMSLINVSLKLWSLNMTCMLNFLLKNVSTHIFSAKITVNLILYLLEQCIF